MPDRYYECAKVPQETLALIAALDDEAMRDVAMMALHKRFNELVPMYDDEKLPPEIDRKDWSAGRAYFARMEKELDAIKTAARTKGFGGCHNPPMNCERGCWFDQDLFPRKR